MFPRRTHDKMPLIDHNMNQENARWRASFLWFWVALTLMWALPLWGLDPHKAITQYGLDTWTRADGLPQSTISAILQTHDGYLWFGTEEGLVRFDGVRFTVFNSLNTPAMVEQDVRKLFEDRNGTLWIATNAHLISYRAGKWIDRLLPDGYADHPNLCLYQSADGTIWVGSNGKFGTLQGKVIRDFKDQKGSSLDGAGTIFETKDSSIWIAFRGLFRLKDGLFSTACPNKQTAPISCAAIDHHETIWFGTEGGGVGRLQNGACSYLPDINGTSHDYVTSILPDRDDNIWVGTIGNGLRRYGESGVATLSMKNGFCSNQVMSLFEDREGSIWIGTNGGGLCRLRDGRCTSYSAEEGVNGSFAQAVCEGADGSIWIGTNEGGITQFRSGQVISHLTTKDGLSNDSVTNLMFDRNGDLWIGTGGGGLNRISHGKLDSHPRGADVLGPIIFSIYEDRAGVVWIGCMKGLWRWQDQKFEKIPGVDSYPMCMEEDKSGRLWIGTMTGGLKCLFEGRLSSYAAKEGLSKNILVSLHADENNVLWIGTIGGGLDRFHDNKFTHVTMKQGLLSNTICGILQDEAGNLWMSCNNGVFHASKKELDRVAMGMISSVHCVSFDESDGMRNRECTGGGQSAACRAKDGGLWFTTVNGVVHVDPHSPRLAPVPPQVFVEEMSVMGRKVGGLDFGFPTALAAGSDRLEFQYTGLSFLKPKRVQFRYKLEGFDREWIDAHTRRTAFYTNIPPGKYTFRVTAADSNSVWNSTDASIEFRLKPHFYQTIWFDALIVVTMICIIHALYRIRARRLLAIERVRTRIATDLHDDVGAGLTHIAIVSEMIKKQIKLNRAEAEGMVSTVADTARELVESMTDVVWAIDPKLDDLASLIVRIRKFSSEILEAKGIKLEMRVPKDALRVRVGSNHRRQILLIFKEAVNNAVKYASCSSVVLSLDCRDRSIVGEIHDDGQGFDCLSVVPRGSGRGLASMRDRAERLGGSLAIASEPGCGTRITFTIPLKSHEHAI